MGIVIPFRKPTQAQIDAHVRLLSLPGVKADPAAQATIRAILAEWGAADAPVTPLDVPAPSWDEDR